LIDRNTSNKTKATKVAVAETTMIVTSATMALYAEDPTGNPPLRNTIPADKMITWKTGWNRRQQR
jgi:hypothetical protein